MNPEDTTDAYNPTDLLLMVAQRGAILGILKRLPDGRDIARDILLRRWVEHGIDIYLEPWPADRAADMLAAWRDAKGPGPVRVDVFEVA